MNRITNYYWDNEKGLFVQIRGDERYYYVYLSFEDLECQKLSVCINQELYDEEHNKEDYIGVLKLLYQYDINRYIRGKIDECFARNGVCI